MTKGILVTMVGTGEITPTKQHKAIIGVKIHIMSRMLPIKASHAEMKIVLCMAMVQVMLPLLGTIIIVRETSICRIGGPQLDTSKQARKDCTKKYGGRILCPSSCREHASYLSC